MKVVAKSPLKVQFSGLHSKFFLSQPEPGQLRLLPNLGVRVLAWFLCVLGWPLLILVLLALIVLLSGRTFEGFDQFEQVMGILFLLIFGSPVFLRRSCTARPAFCVRLPNRRNDDPALLANPSSAAHGYRGRSSAQRWSVRQRRKAGY